jgi:hypothetical protein
VLQALNPRRLAGLVPELGRLLLSDLRTTLTFLLLALVFALLVVAALGELFVGAN